MKQPLLRIFVISLITIVLFACQEKAEKEAAKNVEEKAQVKLESKEKAGRIKTIFYSLPSPLELTILFKQEGVEYHYDKLHNPSNRDKYITTVKKGLNLGIYGADLSYAGLFAKHSDAIQYFSVSQVIAADLGIGQTFQREFITRLENNANNKDTLLQVITDFFLENDSYLKDQNQQNISTYVLVGGWIEGLYLGTHMVSNKTNANGIREIIIGQLASLNNLLVLLDDVGRSQEMQLLKSKMELLRSYYDELEPVKTEEAKTKIEEGELVIDTGEELATMSDETFEKIKELVTEIRSTIIR